MAKYNVERIIIKDAHVQVDNIENYRKGLLDIFAADKVEMIYTEDNEC
jgi:hypothetical protein